MKKYLQLTTVSLTTFLLIGCGGGGGSVQDDLSYEDSYKAYVPLKDNPKTFICSKNTQSNMFELDNYYSTNTKCSTNAQKWIDSINKDDAPNTQEKRDALAYLNSIRKKVGLPIFHGNKKLEDAAKNHENYLGDVYDNYDTVLGHEEDNVNYPSNYYTGVTGTDRAKYIGYTGDYAGDVISFNDSNSTESIRDLINSLYHREALFWNFSNEIGMGGSETYYTLQAYVHLMGRKLDRWRFLKSISTKLAVYPYENQTDFETTMEAESPDPTPDIDTDVGNPITLDFNDLKVDNVEVSSFKLYYDSNNTEVENVRLIDASSDVNHRLSTYQFALIPLDVLHSNTTYRVEVSYVADGKSESKIWRFTTK